MYQAVKAVCEAKPAVWRRSEAFEDAFADFCRCIENILRLQPGGDIFKSVTEGILVEMQVADKILTNDMDEFMEQFEAVDVAFVDDYTAARSMDFADENAAPVPARPGS